MSSENSDMRVATVARRLRGSLAAQYGLGEAKAMVNLIFHALKGWDQTALIINSDQPLSQYTLDRIEGIERRLLDGEPIQYILGEAYFYGMNLKVTPDTLIPRPETEELVDMIVRSHGDTKDLDVLDVGTGSGAIAIALSRNLPFSRVTAIDISAGALAVARENAKTLHASVRFAEEDIFKYEPQADSFDIIVSNPPYICESEKAGMERNVLEHEPHSALFVPDSQPLVYYSRIATVGSDALRKGGMLYFEINPRHAAELAAMLRAEGYADIAVVKDINGRERFIHCVK